MERYNCESFVGEPHRHAFTAATWTAQVYVRLHYLTHVLASGCDSKVPIVFEVSDWRRRLDEHNGLTSSLMYISGDISLFEPRRFYFR
jgi:hypothetical protein